MNAAKINHLFVTNTRWRYHDKMEKLGRGGLSSALNKAVCEKKWIMTYILVYSTPRCGSVHSLN